MDQQQRRVGTHVLFVIVGPVTVACNPVKDVTLISVHSVRSLTTPSVSIVVSALSVKRRIFVASTMMMMMTCIWANKLTS
mmetsp:Transcript_15210/g.25783  ORF Transcript_15210/g.25783 Transcript_15210/m.25783 type:complete len:80 (-) Transcript_15210:11-250(-)